MADLLLRMVLGATCGIAFVLLLRQPARRMFGAAPAFTLWLLPLLMGFAPLLPRHFVDSGVWTLPPITIAAHGLPSGVHAASVLSVEEVLIALWSVGAILALCRLMLHYWRLLRSIAPMPKAWHNVIAATAPDLSTHRVRVHAAGPAVVWALRTLVLLPPDFTVRFDTNAQWLVLRHELTHVRRGDAFWLLLAELACAMLWFHPLAWLALPRFRLDQELACDERSLRSLPGGSSQYARALLGSVAARQLPALIPWLAEPQLKERIAMISRIRPGALRRRAGFLAVAVLFTMSVLLVGGQKPVEAATEARTASTPSVDTAVRSANPPTYPADAIKAKQQGFVVLNVTIDADGYITGITVDRKATNAPAELQQSALLAATHWKFNPGSKNGRPVGGVVRVPVIFSLDEGLGTCPTGEGHASVPPFKCISLQSATHSS